MLLVFILCIYVNKPESKVLITNKTNIIPVYKEYDKDSFSLEELRSKYNNNDIIGKIKINDKNNYHLFFYCIEKSKILAI